MKIREDRFLSALYEAVFEAHHLLSKSMLRVDWSGEEEQFVRVALAVLRELLSMIEKKRRESR